MRLVAGRQLVPLRAGRLQLDDLHLDDVGLGEVVIVVRADRDADAVAGTCHLELFECNPRPSDCFGFIGGGSQTSGRSIVGAFGQRRNCSGRGYRIGLL